MEKKQETRGRPPIGEKRMTDAERGKRSREKVIDSGGQYVNVVLKDPGMTTAFNNISKDKSFNRQETAVYLIKLGILNHHSARRL